MIIIKEETLHLQKNYWIKKAKHVYDMLRSG